VVCKTTPSTQNKGIKNYTLCWMTWKWGKECVNRVNDIWLTNYGELGQTEKK